MPIFKELKKSRKIFAITFLLILGLTVLNYSFFRAWIKFNKSGFRKELLTSAPSSVQQIAISLNDIYVDKNGIEWHEDNKEISISGQFYEVIKVERTANNAIVYIIKDDKENQLFSSFFSKKAGQDNFIFCLVKLVFGMNFDSTFGYDFSLSSKETSSSPVFRYFFSDSGFHFEIIKPPCNLAPLY